MRKIIPIVVLALVVAAGGGYWFMWNQKATKLKSDIETMVTTIYSNKNVNISYESLNVSGFPKEINVTVKKPAITLQVNPLLGSFFADPVLAASFGGFDHDALKPGWVEKTEIDGDLVIGGNAIGKDFYFRSNGIFTSTSTLEGEETLVMQTTKPNDFGCSVSINDSIYNSGTREIISNAGSNPSRMFALLKSLECKNDGFSYVKKGSTTSMYDAGPSRIFFGADSSSGMTNYSVAFKVKDTKATPEMDAVIARYFDAVGEKNRHIIGRPQSLSALGNQNVDVDFTVSMSDGFSDSGNGKLAIDFKSFLFTNDLMKSSGDFDMALDKNTTLTDFKLKSTSSTQIAEAYDTQMQGSLVDMMDSLIANPMFRGDAVIETLATLTPEQRQEIATKVAPKLSSLGEIKSDIRVGFNAQGDVAQNPMTPGKLAIDAFDITTTPYGLKSNGAFDLANILQPKGSLKVSLVNAVQLVDDIVAYAKRLQDAIQPFDEEAAAAMEIPEGLVSGIKHFLHELSETKDATYTYNFASTPDGMFTVSGKSLMEVMALFETDIMQQLPQTMITQPDASSEPGLDGKQPEAENDGEEGTE